MKNYTIWIKVKGVESDPRRIEVKNQSDNISRVLLNTWKNIGLNEHVVGIICTSDVCRDDII